MRILLVHQYFLELDDGGGSRFNEMARQWTEMGHQVTVIGGMMHANGSEKRKEYKGKLFAKKNHDKVTVHRTHVSESYNNGFLGRLWGYFSFVFSSSWAGLFRVKGKFDVILVTSPPLFVGITALILSFFSRVPVVFEVRDLWPESAIDTGVLTNKFIIKIAYWFESRMYNKATLINVLTPAFQKKIVGKGIEPNKIIYIPNAADFSIADKLIDFDALQFKDDLGLKGKFVITYVGAHGVANHLVQVLDAADKLSGTNVIFQLIGSGMQKEHLVKETKKRKLENVIFRPPVSKEEIFKYILSSDMGASILKKVDTFKTIYSNKTFDYMSCSKPVFLAIDGISRELIEEADCGVYVEPEDADDWVRKIQKILVDVDDLPQLGKNGREYAKKHFDRNVLAKKYIDEIAKKIA